MDEREITDFYILFHNHTEGMALYRYLHERGLRARVCPVPRAASACCGVSLLVSREDFAAVWAAVEQSGLSHMGYAELPRNIDPHRDRYC